MRFEVGSEHDVFALRQRARVAASALGMDPADQIRVATALSELGREVLNAGGADVLFAVDQRDRGPVFLTTLSTRRPWAGDDGPSSGLAAARRLGDDLTVKADAGAAVFRFSKRLPRQSVLERGCLARVRAAVAATVPSTPLEELRAQNRELVDALDALNAQTQQLLELNTELGETNQGVMAMYNQLSAELDETNRGVVALYAEIDQKAVEVAAANDAKTRFLNNVSHELRTPVNSILGLVRLIDQPDDPVSTEVGLIASCANDLSALVDDLLDLAKAESGRLEPTLEEVSLPQMLASLRATLRPLITSPDVVLKMEAAPDLPTIESDPGLLTIVLRNLINNAIKYTEWGEIVVRAELRESTQHVTVTVTDTGVGIAAADHDRIFEAFHQVRGAHQTKRKGTGLGLPYARRLTGLLGGTLSMESEEGRGSVFRVELPVRFAPVPSFGSPAGDPVDVRIGVALVVDDDPAFRHVLRGMLQDVAGRVVEAGDGHAALTEIRALRPDVVFLDLRMPEVDGMAVLEAMTTDPELRDVPVLVTTSVDLDAGVLGATSPV
ncbi:MAG TPA: ATP-binding protein, partial [Acidimicrobiia bacterium]|nr:ATP-binding protein [Acidimicrobiia bacterium]